tara:strand:- start:72 stop:416 length:345 start_codon:yes stop_codon:yes gene_type:complete
MTFNHKDYYQKKKEIVLLRSKIYAFNNPEKILEYKQTYNKSEKGRKKKCIWKWKKIGIKDPCLEYLYDYLITQTHCWICLKKYEDSSERCLDHDHETGEPRYICCRNCNLNFLR